MKIAFIDTLGLCYDGSTLSKRGLGGSESAVIYMSKELTRLGFEVTVFNDCTSDDASPGEYDGVRYCSLNDVESSSGFDVVVASRSVAAFAPPEQRKEFKSFIGLPDFTNIMAKSKHKVLWMHDTFCDGDNLIEYFINTGRINEIFTLSDWHTSYITNCDHGMKRNFDVLKRNIFQTRNGIGIAPEWVDVKNKDPNLFVYNSSVTKGMIPLVTKIWPEVKKRIPDAKLTVIGGYYKFREGSAPDQQQQDWHKLVAEHPEVNFTGVITQKEISDILKDASYMVYPAAFPETFGISTLEALAHNVPLITCRFGALEETAIDLASYKINYTVERNWSCPWLNEDQQIAAFIELVCQSYNDKYLHQQKMYACNRVKDICTWYTVALQWKQHLYNKLGEFLPVDEYRRVSKINHKVHNVFGRRWMNPEELTEQRPHQKDILIITPVYNAEKYIARCIESVAQQDYDRYTMYITDDCSTDNTAQVIQDTIDNLPLSIRHNFHLVYNVENNGAVFNQVTSIEESGGHGDIVILLDGDDWLVNDPNIFHRYNNMYNEGAEFTYGSCWSLADSIPLIAQEYPPEVKAKKAYRNYKFNWNMPYTHLRTFKWDMMKEVLDSSGYKPFQDAEGNWLKAGGDTAVFYAMIEQADPDRVVCVTDIVYNYNDLNPLNDYKINSEEQTKTAQQVIRKGNDEVKRILIAIPCKNDIEADTFKSIYDLEVPEGYTTDFQYFYGYAVDQVRNLIADWTIKGYDYLFAVDHDMIFPKDTLKKLLAADKDVVSAVYRQRLEPQAIELYDLHHNRLDVGQLVEGVQQVGGCGFGCVLVKKEVFAAIGYPQFVYHQALSHNDTFSEDMDFCKKATNKGFTIWSDTSILCGHIGQRVFEVSNSKSFEWQGNIKNA